MRSFVSFSRPVLLTAFLLATMSAQLALAAPCVLKPTAQGLGLDRSGISFELTTGKGALLPREGAWARVDSLDKAIEKIRQWRAEGKCEVATELPTCRLMAEPGDHPSYSLQLTTSGFLRAHALVRFDSSGLEQGKQALQKLEAAQLCAPGSSRLVPEEVHGRDADHGHQGDKPQPSSDHGHVIQAL